jgi:hypothetical protein
MFKSNFQDIFITHLSFRAKRSAVEKLLILGYKFVVVLTLYCLLSDSSTRCRSVGMTCSLY